MNLKVEEERRGTGGDSISSEYFSAEGHRAPSYSSPPLLLPLLSFSFYGEFAFFNYSKSQEPRSKLREGLRLPAVSFCLFLLCSLPTIKGTARIEFPVAGLVGPLLSRFVAVTTSRHFHFPSSPSHHDTRGGAVRSPPDPALTPKRLPCPAAAGCLPWSCQVDEAAYAIYLIKIFHKCRNLILFDDVERFEVGSPSQ